MRPRFPAELLKTQIEHVKTPMNERTVYFVTGSPVTARSERKDKKARLEETMALVDGVMDFLDTDDERREKIGLLNSQHRSAQLIKEAIPNVEAVISDMPETTERLSMLKRHSTNVIEAVKHNPGIVYQPTAGSPRLFPASASILQMPRVFRLLTLAYCGDNGEVVEADLSYVHLAIIAAKWDLAETTALIVRNRELGTSIWTEFLDYLGLDKSFKPILKKSIYSIVYGMVRNNNRRDRRGKPKPSLRRQFLEGDPKSLIPVKGVGDPVLWTKFVNHPVVAELLQARDVEANRVLTDGGRYDAWGNWINHRDRRTGQLKPRSILSYVSQSYEQLFMYKLLDRIEQSKRVYVLAYVHDGMSLHLSDPARTGAYVSGLKRIIEQCSKEMGILTGLEVEYLNSDEALQSVNQVISELAAAA